MSPVLADVLQVSALIAVLALVHRPFGDYMAAVYSSSKHLRVERLIYRAIGANPDAEQRWPAHLRGVLAFSAVSVLFLYLLKRKARGFQDSWTSGRRNSYATTGS